MLNYYYKNQDASHYYQYKAKKGLNLTEMENDLTIKKVRTTKLNGSNY
jgi:hypothetical protein